MVSSENLAALSKHEILFGFTKSSKYWHGGILQIVQLTLGICSAWTIMALCSEVSTILTMMGDTSASTEIPSLLIWPLVQINMLAVSFKIFADWLPECVNLYSTETNTEMMKDRDIIEQVIQS